MLQMDIDQEGLMNVTVGLAEQARKDFVKGAKILYAWYGRIPEHKEWVNLGSRDTHQREIFWMYDAWDFVKKDPYDMFDVGEKAIIDSWKNDAILKYYRELYLPGATTLVSKMNIDYKNKHDRKSRPVPSIWLHKIPKKDLEKNLNPTECKCFIEARDYILKSGRVDILEKCAVIACERAKRAKRAERNFRKKYNL